MSVNPHIADTTDIHKELTLKKLMNTLDQIYGFYQNIGFYHPNAGSLEINHIKMLLNSDNVSHAELSKAVDTLIDMKKYASATEAITFNEAIELLNDYVFSR